MWYVEFLLLNREEIRRNADIESDEYSNLLEVESKLDELISTNLISDDELNLLNLYLNNPSKTVVNEFKIGRDTINNSFRNVCRKIGFALGGIFTQDGYVEYMRNKYHLTDEQCNRLLAFMKSPYRHKIAQRIHMGVK